MHSAPGPQIDPSSHLARNDAADIPRAEDDGPDGPAAATVCADPEHPIKGNGAVDILVTRPGETVVVEIETGKSDTSENLAKSAHAEFDKIVLVATSPGGQRGMSEGYGGCHRWPAGAVADVAGHLIVLRRGNSTTSTIPQFVSTCH